MTPPIRQIPVLRLSYGNRLLIEIGAREPTSLDAIFAAVDPEKLFKSDQEHKAPRERALACLRFAEDIGLVESSTAGLRLTDAGRRYVDAADPADAFAVTDAQAAILREQMQSLWTASGMLYGAALSLVLRASADPEDDISREQLGRALAAVSGKEDWVAARTFASQGDRFTAFLKEAGLLDASEQLTAEGQAMLDDIELPDIPPIAEVLASLDQGGGRKAWIIRAGEKGENEAVALEHDAAVVGWERVATLDGRSHDELADEIGARYANDYEGNRRRIGQAAGQLWAFASRVAIGDVVVLPLRRVPRHVAIGIVRGGYRRRDEPAFQHDARHTRDVEWIAKAVPYERFDETLTRRFELQGTVRQIQLPDAATRVLAAIAPPSESAIHLVLKWSKTHGPQTVDLHREVVDAHGCVWWRVIGKAGAPTLGQTFLNRFRAQLDRGEETDVYLFGPTCWRTRMLDFRTTPPDAADAQLVPPYYDLTAHGLLWVKLTDFEPREREWLTSNLALANDPSKTVSGHGDRRWAVVVRRRDPQSPPAGGPAVWWVNQTSTYAISRDGGFLWAPQLAKDGHPRQSWELLKEANVGDLVLHCASGHVRAVSRVAAPWVEAPRPAGFPADDSSDGDGYLVRTGYRELAEPITVGDIGQEWRTAEHGPFDVNGRLRQGYFFRLGDAFVGMLAERFPQLGVDAGDEPHAASYEEPPFTAIHADVLDAGMAITERMLRRYHVALKTRGFVILAGVSGTGKTWLAELYANAVGAAHRVVPVAPNWTTNEDLLGYWNPLDATYHDTTFSQFLRDAAAEYASARAQQRDPQPFHLVLDEMNLAHVEYYFAKFLSAMELRARNTTATVDLGPNMEVLLPPNLVFIGTVNIDETTKGFADKVYDRAQVLELELDAEQLAAHVEGRPYEALLMDIFRAVRDVAPFAFRTLDDIARYVDEMDALGAPIDEALDEQILQKILPKLKGTDQRIATALGRLRDLTQSAHPLSHAKVSAMLETFTQHGFASYF